MCLPVEPFKIEREWEHAGLKCAVVQAREGAHRCGYVRVPPTHALHGKDYDTPDVQVHGGLTFGRIEDCAHEDGIGWWFGFDCAHSGDQMYEPEFNPAWGREARAVWRIHQDSLERYPGIKEHYWTQAEVERETEKLAEQLAALKVAA